ncbi:MAG: hypothetical protein SNJ59_06300 [Aggregatilineales bacterium]
MSVEGLLIILLVVIASVVFIALPFTHTRAGSFSPAEIERQKERDALVTHYRRVVAAIRDLDEDFRTGKLPAETYEADRAAWMDQGAAVLQALEAFDGDESAKQAKRKDGTKRKSAESTADAALADSLLDDAIERAIANYNKAKVHQ